MNGRRNHASGLHQQNPLRKTADPRGNALRLGITLAELTPQLLADRHLTGVQGLYVKEIDPNGLVAELRIPPAGHRLDRRRRDQSHQSRAGNSLADFQRVLNGLKAGDPIVLNVTRVQRDRKGDRQIPLIVQFTYQYNIANCRLPIAVLNGNRQLNGNFMAQAKKAISKTSGKLAARNAARAAVKTYHNYIDGEWVASESGEMFENINPADNRDIVGRFPLSTSDDVNAAVNAAQGAFDRWRNTRAKRAELLFRLGEILIRNKEQFTADMTREMGKVLKEAGGDVQEAIDCTYYTAGEGRRLHGFTTPAEMRDKFAMCVRQPVGLCGLITPWNFPMAIPVVETDSGADLRQHRRAQTRRRHAAFDLQPREGL